MSPSRSSANKSALLHLTLQEQQQLMMATPIGWVGLIVGGAAIVGTAAVASISMNNYLKDNSGDTYDMIMRKLNAL